MTHMEKQAFNTKVSAGNFIAKLLSFHFKKRIMRMKLINGNLFTLSLCKY